MKQRRLLRYSLRSMLVVVLVLSVWLGYMANRAAEQRRAVEALRKSGAWVDYDFELPAHEGLTPGWLRGILADDWAGRPVAVGFFNATDTNLENLSRLRGVRMLVVEQIDGTGVDFGRLDRLRNLEKLSFSHADEITDVHLRQIARLTSLKKLRLSGPCPNVTDAGMAHLRRLHNLEELVLHTPGVTLEGYSRLGELPSLSTMEVVDMRRDLATRLQNALPGIEVDTTYSLQDLWMDLPEFEQSAFMPGPTENEDTAESANQMSLFFVDEASRSE